MIPKILHFTWKTAALTGLMKRYFARWRSLHPGWDIRLWTDETMRAFVAERHPGLLATYDSYARMIQRADAFRCLALLTFGGVYADLDIKPLRPIDPLTGLDAFVGVEPAEHIGGDRVHAGLPYLFSNAFMGARPGHPLFKLVASELQGLAGQETFFSTGPSMLTAMVLQLDLRDRPALLMARVWSPLRDGGLPTRGDGRLQPLLEGIAPLVSGERGALVSHKWLTTWVPFYRRPNLSWALFQVPARLRWGWRRRRHRALAAVRISDPLRRYDDQRLAPAAPGPAVVIGVRLDGGAVPSAGLVAALRRLDYPAALARVVVHSGASTEGERAAVRAAVEAAGWSSAEVLFGGGASRAAATNGLVARGAALAPKVLLVGGAVTAIPADALRLALGAPAEVVAASVIEEGGRPDLSVFRYRHRPDFRILYKVGGLSGLVSPLREHRVVPQDQRAFRVVPLDGVGDSFVLIDSAVVGAGAFFAETPHKLHLGGEAFGIMARDLGFEVAGLPGVEVVVGAAP